MPLKYGNMEHSTVAHEPLKMESLSPQHRAVNKYQKEETVIIMDGRIERESAETWNK